jgi:AcrR family transcriptional regulator
MGSVQRKEKEKEIRRNDIIDAAERVFFSKGFDGCTMDDVAREAEFSKRTVYVYFNSKEQIHFEIMIRGYKLFLGMLKENMNTIDSSNAVEDLKQIAMTLYKFSIDYPHHFDAIMQYENSELDYQKGVPDKSREECYALGEESLSYLIRLLQEGAEEGSVRSDLEIKKTALALWASIIGVFNIIMKKKNYITNFHGIQPEELLLQAIDLMKKSIQSEVNK